MPSYYQLPFIKLQALGNDFVFLDAELILDSAARPLLSQWHSMAPILARKLCQRKFSIGADGLILAIPLVRPELLRFANDMYGQDNSDCNLSWTYHNSDGSISSMCGNGLRCLALWAREEKKITEQLKVATALGSIPLDYRDPEDITLMLGSAKLAASEIPYRSDKTSLIREPFSLGDFQFPITCVNVGNPHCVIFEADFVNSGLFQELNEKREIGETFFPESLAGLAAAIEIDNRFPEKTNVEFVNVVNRNHIQVFVWERGSKATLACGSGAVAAAIAGVLEGRLDKKVKVTLPGGDLFVDYSDENMIKMTGGAAISFYGHIQINNESFNSMSKINYLKAQVS